VRGDLVKTLLNLQKRRPPFFRKRKFDRVLIETTGVAEPAPLLRTFLIEEQIAENFRVDALVTLVDSKHASSALNEPAAEEQIALADVLLLNKTDLAEDTALHELREQLSRRNPIAAVFECIQSEVDLHEVLAQRAQQALPETHTHHAGDGHAEISSICLRESRPLDPLQTQLWLNSCAALLSGKLIRYKGFLHFDGEPNQAILQGVYELYTVSAGEPWDKDEPRITELVFIGRDLEEAFLRHGLEACLA
jgi:G3E family GTPase